MRNNRAFTTLRWLWILIALVATIFPIYWLVVLSTQSTANATGMSLIYVPRFDAFAEVWQNAAYLDSLLMSVLVVALTVALSLLVVVPAAYALTRFRIRARVGIVAWLLISYLLPDFLIAIPLYAIYQNIGLYDTAPGLAIAYQVFMAPLAMWLLLGFFRDVPEELAEAAKLDGCTDLGTLVRVYLPVVGPGIATTAVLIATTVWNEVTIALALTLNNPTVPIQVASYRGYGSVQWDTLAAAALIATAPVVLFAVFAQRFIVRGLTAGIGK